MVGSWKVFFLPEFSSRKNKTTQIFVYNEVTTITTNFYFSATGVIDSTFTTFLRPQLKSTNIGNKLLNSFATNYYISHFRETKVYT